MASLLVQIPHHLPEGINRTWLPGDPGLPHLGNGLFHFLQLFLTTDGIGIGRCWSVHPGNRTPFQALVHFLGGEVKVEKSIDLTAGIPKPVKKTFAEQVSTKEMDKRLKGSAITGVNTPAPANASPVGRKEELKQVEKPVAKVGQSAESQKPGSIDPFRQMVRDLNK